MGKVEAYYKDMLAREGAMLFSLIDPDKSPLEAGAQIAAKSAEGGADVILVGGSIGAQGSVLDESVKMIKEAAPNIPITLFPGSIAGFSQFADAIYFMHMLNSRDIYWLSTAQVQSAPFIARTKVEPIPTAYLVLEPGRAVGWVGNANLVPRDRPDLAAACALAARFSGSHVFITDSGSGAPDPAPLPLISAVSKACGSDMMYFLAGGVRTPQQAQDSIAAGAHGIHVGTAFEEGDVLEKVRTIRKAVKDAGKKRV
jgi:phosphoglycerol geranylgeranyltransferase